MTRNNFLNILAQSITHLSQEEQNDILFDYTEHFRIGMEQGKTEEEIASSLGDPELIASQYSPRSAPSSPERGKKPLIYLSILTGIIVVFIAVLLFIRYFNIDEVPVYASSSTSEISSADTSLPSAASNTTPSSQAEPSGNAGKDSVMKDSGDEEFGGSFKDGFKDGFKAFNDTFENNMESFVDSVENNIGVTPNDIDIQKSSSLKGIQSLDISDTFASIQFIKSEGEEIKVHLHGAVRSTGAFAPGLEMSKNGSRLSFKMNKSPGSLSINASNLVMDVYLPESFTGEVQLTTTSGDIDVNGYNFKDINCHTTSGDIKLQKGKNIKSVNCETVSGDIALSELASNKVSVETSSGNIQLATISAELNLNTVSGDVTISEVISDKLSVETSSGNIHLNTISAEMNLNSVSGDISVACKELKNDLTANSISGSVKLKLPDKADFKLKAQSGSGTISNSFSMMQTKSGNRNTLEGVVNSGNYQIDLATVSGDINILN
ncbi:MAG: rane protein-like protein [Eubacterium sp.]|nr:rane protein-like protein [Eubacterium sp.]